MCTNHKEGNNNNINYVVGCNNWTEVSYRTTVLGIRVYRHIQQPENQRQFSYKVGSNLQINNHLNPYPGHPSKVDTVKRVSIPFITLSK